MSAQGASDKAEVCTGWERLGANLRRKSHSIKTLQKQDSSGAMDTKQSRHTGQGRGYNGCHGHRVALTQPSVSNDTAKCIQRHSQVYLIVVRHHKVYRAQYYDSSALRQGDHWQIESNVLRIFVYVILSTGQEPLGYRGLPVEVRRSCGVCQSSPN